ncbi:MAG TPA: hypothetical protein VK338_00845, partial [Candidatus Nitrosocosmicus sp.]|nr:hypothetical protein [Candidatus Nitrosocosmicus sp.]
MRKGIVIITIITIITVIFSPASAQSPTVRPNPSPTTNQFQNIPEPPAGLNVVLSPTFINLVTDPGTPVSSQIKIRNNNNFKEYLKMGISRFEAADGGERPLIVDVTDRDVFAKWIDFSENQFTVDPNENKTIKFTISPPKDASLGYYYAITVTRIRENQGENNPAVVTGAPSILALVEVRSPNAKREVQLVDFKTTSLFYEYFPVEFKMKLKNTGNIHVVPTGDIFIDQGSKKDVAIIQANEGRSNILPNTERTFTARWDDAFIRRVPKIENGQPARDDKGNIKYETKWDLSKADRFRIGKYTDNV